MRVIPDDVYVYPPFLYKQARPRPVRSLLLLRRCFYFVVALTGVSLARACGCRLSMLLLSSTHDLVELIGGQ